MYESFKNIDDLIDGLSSNRFAGYDRREDYDKILEQNISGAANAITVQPVSPKEFRRLIGMKSEITVFNKRSENEQNPIKLDSLTWESVSFNNSSIQQSLKMFPNAETEFIVNINSVGTNQLAAKYTLEQFQTLSQLAQQITSTYTDQTLQRAWKEITKLITAPEKKGSSTEEKDTYKNKVAAFKLSFEKCASVLSKLNEIDFSNADVPYVSNDLLELIVSTINESNEKLDIIEKKASSDDTMRDHYSLIKEYIRMLSEFLEKSKERISDQDANDDQTTYDEGVDVTLDDETLKAISFFDYEPTEAAIKRPPGQTRADGNGPAANVQRLMKEKNISFLQGLTEAGTTLKDFKEDLFRPVDDAYVGGGNRQITDAEIIKRSKATLNQIWSTMDNMRLIPVDDNDQFMQNNVTNKMYVYDDHPTGVEKYAFAETEKDSLGGSLLTALPYVNNRFMFINRNNQDSGDTGIKTRAYRDTKTSLNKDEAEAHQKHAFHLYTEAGFLKLMQNPDLNRYPEFVLHSMIYPPIANPENQSHVASDLERRFIKTKRMPLMMRIAARFVLLTSFSLQQMNKWYDNNIAIPLGGMVMRPWEEMTMYSQIALAEYQIGEFFFSGFDNLVSFDPSAQHFQVNEFFHGAPVVENDSIFIFAKDTRGGADKGGKGNRYINSRPDGQVLPLDPRLWDEYEQYNAELVEEARTVIDEHLYRGERLGNFSNIPVLQGYNTAIEKTTPLHFDIRGNWQPVDFAGRLEHSEEFMLTRPKPMYDGQFTVNYVLPLKKMRTDFDLHTLSHAQKTLLTRYNNHVHQTTFWVYDENQNEVEEKSHHPLGDEYPGYRDDQTSRNLIPASKANIRVY
jgi:hypothetical protein